MRGALEQLRERNPGKWLLIQLDEPEAEAGTVLVADENPDVVNEQLSRRFQDKGRITIRPLYVTYALPEGEELPGVIL